MEWPGLLGPDGNIWAKVTWADLFWFEAHPLLLVKIVGTRSFSAQEIAWLGEAAPCWHPTHHGGTVAQWKIGQRELSLREWVLGEVLAHPPSKWHTVEGRLHWFGSDLPSFNICHVQDGIINKTDADDLIVRLSLGKSKWAEGTGPDHDTVQTIIDSYLQEWENWRLYVWRDRLTLLLHGLSQCGQPDNSERYYSLLFALVCYQRVRLTDFLDRASGQSIDMANLRKEFMEFRRRYLPHRVTTYPLGDRVYDYIRMANKVPDIQREIEDEIRLGDETERLKLERDESRHTLILTIIAAVFLPATLATGIFGMNSMTALAWDWSFLHYFLAALLFEVIFFFGLRALIKR